MDREKRRRRDEKAIGGGVLDPFVLQRNEPPRIAEESEEFLGIQPSSPSQTRWNDVVGNAEAKRVLYESCILPSVLPSSVFVGCREIQSSIILYGPPGTGKTLLARAIAGETQWTFIEMSPSECLSKWSGESERRVRRGFEMARRLRPSILFFDEIDSIACDRGSIEEIASRRLLSEFLIQMSALSVDDQILVLAATNRIQDIDEAVLRRFHRRVAVPLPGKETRSELIRFFLRGIDHDLHSRDLDRIASDTDGWSASDTKAAMNPLRELDIESYLRNASQLSIRPVRLEDFLQAFEAVRPAGDAIRRTP